MNHRRFSERSNYIYIYVHITVLQKQFLHCLTANQSVNYKLHIRRKYGYRRKYATAITVVPDHRFHGKGAHAVASQALLFYYPYPVISCVLLAWYLMYLRKQQCTRIKSNRKSSNPLTYAWFTLRTVECWKQRKRTRNGRKRVITGNIRRHPVNCSYSRPAEHCSRLPHLCQCCSSSHVLCPLAFNRSQCVPTLRTKSTN